MCGGVVHLFRRHSGTEHRVREGAKTERSDEDDGTEQRRSLDVMVHHKYRYYDEYRRLVDHCSKGLSPFAVTTE